MLNNSYFEIYNNSFDIFYKNLNFYINDDKEKFKRKYEIVNSKKITGYMLFVREYYKKNSSHKNSKKNISIEWERLKNKDEYNDKAKKILEYYNKLINKKIKVKKTKVEVIIDNNEEDIMNKLTYELKKINIEEKEYYIDSMDNLIDIEKEEYIGYLDKNNKVIII